MQTHAEPRGLIMSDPSMASEVVRLRPGPAAVRWLLRRVADLQGGDPLRPVTVVVPGNHAGLFLRRRLAASGYANVRFSVLPRLAEGIGSVHLSRTGRTTLAEVVGAALMRDALAAGGGALASGTDHAGLVDLLMRMAAELRRLPDRVAVVERVKDGGRTPAAAVATVAEYERRREAAGLADDVDLLRAATAALTDGAGAPAMDDVGDVIVFLVPELDPPERELLEALARHVRVVVAAPDVAAPAHLEQDGRTPAAAVATVLVAADPVAEVRAAVRAVLAAAERDVPVPFHRTAVVYRDEETYATLLRDTLAEAGVPFSSLDGRRLSDSVPARGLLGLVRLRSADFARAAVLSWLSGLPHRGAGVLRSQARWDRLSREAGVVRGAKQWRDRLTRYAEACEHRLRELDADDEEATVEARRAALRGEIDDARRIAEQIAGIDAATAPPADPTWAAHVDWALRLRDEFLTPDGAWSDEDREASQMVEEVVRGLAAAQAVEPRVFVGLFLRTLEDGLRARRRPEGRLGNGVVIGPHRLLLGMEIARVHVLGAVEDAFPAPAPVDPLLPGDPLGRRASREAEERRDWLAALAAADGGEVTVSAPMVDVDGRAVYPSPWLLDLLADEGGEPSASKVRSGALRHPRLLRAGGLPGAPGAHATSLTAAERREAEAMAGHAAEADLGRSGLAARADLPFGRCLTVARARRSSELTEFDGNVAAVHELALVARGLCGPIQSATGIETWATCPFRFLLGRILAVRPTEDVEDDRWWQIDAAERGSLVHAILEEFFRGVATTGRPRPGEPYTEQDVRRIEAIAAGAFDDAERRGAVGHPLVWADERAAILGDLRTLLREDAERRAAGGWRPERLEQPFGVDGEERSWPALAMPLDADRTVHFRGFIDRIDVDRAGSSRVIDYKTGSNRRPDVSVGSGFDAGRKLQLPIYGSAVREDARRRGMLPMPTTALYWYATVRGGFAEIPLSVDDRVEEALRGVVRHIDAGVRAGCFPQVPGDFQEWFGSYGNCGFCDYDTLCPASRDVVAAAKADSAALAPYRALRPDAAEPRP